MTELVQQHDASSGEGAVVVFVHGWEDDKHGSWIDTAGKSWPQWLGQDTQCDTWSLDYDASLSAWRDFSGALHINGLSLMDKLATAPELAGRPLIILAHGTGGLLVKKAIVHALTKAAPRHRRMVARIAALGLIATPQSGAQLNTITRAIAVARGADATPGDKDFSADDAPIQELQREFMQLGDNFSAKVHVYAETKPVVIGRKWLGLWKTRAIAVPYDAQISHAANTVVTMLAEDHFTIRQPKDRTAPLHQSITALIDACKASASMVKEAAPEPAQTVAEVREPEPLPPSPPPVSQAPQPEPVVAIVQQSVPEPVETNPVTEKPESPPPQVAIRHITSRPALLDSAQDERLQPNESKLYGRDRELTRLLSFLGNAGEPVATVQSRGVDGGGIGKTELCKAALKLWMQRQAEQGLQGKVFFIVLADEVDQATFLQALAIGIGLDATDDADTVLAAMPAGLYYFDNLGSFALDDSGRQLIERIRNASEVRLLVSSRHALPADFGQSIEIDALPKQSALNLFRDLWSGGDVLPVDTALTQFVDNDLQRHPMSTALLARLGIFFGYDDMRTRWRALRAENPVDHGLLISLRLVGQAISAKTGALAMWHAVAKMPQGIDAQELLRAEADGAYPLGTAEFLQHHHVMSRVGHRFVMSMAAIQVGLAVGADGEGT